MHTGCRVRVNGGSGVGINRYALKFVLLSYTSLVLPQELAQPNPNLWAA